MPIAADEQCLSFEALPELPVKLALSLHFIIYALHLVHFNVAPSKIIGVLGFWGKFIHYQSEIVNDPITCIRSSGSQSN